MKKLLSILAVLISTTASAGYTPAKIAYATITNGGTCTLVTNNAGVASVSTGGTGECTFNFASSYFSAVPTCSATTNSAGQCVQISTNPTTSAVTTTTRNCASGSAGNQPMSIICVGQR
jgi:hypothetical protein